MQTVDAVSYPALLLSLRVCDGAVRSSAASVACSLESDLPDTSIHHDATQIRPDQRLIAHEIIIAGKKGKHHRRHNTLRLYDFMAS
jgi:hypothetical protein